MTELTERTVIQVTQTHNHKYESVIWVCLRKRKKQNSHTRKNNGTQQKDQISQVECQSSKFKSQTNRDQVGNRYTVSGPWSSKKLKAIDNGNLTNREP